MKLSPIVNFVANRVNDGYLKLDTLFQNDSGMKALEEIRTILVDSDISPFEVIHSGLVKILLNYLTVVSSRDKNLRENQLRVFLNVFLGAPVSLRSTTSTSVYGLFLIYTCSSL